jgi:hypothetical protein
MPDDIVPMCFREAISWLYLGIAKSPVYRSCRGDPRGRPFAPAHFLSSLILPSTHPPLS